MFLGFHFRRLRRIKGARVELFSQTTVEKIFDPGTFYRNPTQRCPGKFGPRPSIFVDRAGNIAPAFRSPIIPVTLFSTIRPGFGQPSNSNQNHPGAC
jgi:hypothetical protein